MKIRRYRAAVVCLVLLCVLLLTAVIVLCVTLTQERQQLISKNENLITEREQVMLKNTDLTSEREQLLLKNTNLTTEREQLLLKNTNLTSELQICGKVSIVYVVICYTADILKTMELGCGLCNFVHTIYDYFICYKIQTDECKRE